MSSKSSGQLNMKLYIDSFKNPVCFFYRIDKRSEKKQGSISDLTPLKEEINIQTGQIEKQETTEWPDYILQSIHRQFEEAESVYGKPGKETADGMVFNDLLFHRQNGVQISLKDMLCMSSFIKTSHKREDQTPVAMASNAVEETANNSMPAKKILMSKAKLMQKKWASIAKEPTVVVPSPPSAPELVNGRMSSDEPPRSLASSNNKKSLSSLELLKLKMKRKAREKSPEDRQEKMSPQSKRSEAPSQPLRELPKQFRPKTTSSSFEADRFSSDMSSSSKENSSLQINFTGTKPKQKPIKELENSAVEIDISPNETMKSSNETKDIVVKLKRDVLAHGHSVPCAINSVEEANFTLNFTRKMSSLFSASDLYRINAYVWPHLNCGGSATVIATKKCGKTTSYLPTICNMIEKVIKKQLQPPKPVSPYAIVVMKSSQAVTSAAKQAQRFLQKKTDILWIIEGYGLHQDELRADLLMNCCGILFITAQCFLRLLTDESLFFNYDRTQFLVIDEYDEIKASISEKELKTIMLFFENAFEKRPKGAATQLIITSNVWMKDFNHFLSVGNNHMLFIANYIEAAAYSRVHFNVTFTPREEKVLRVLEILKNGCHTSEKTAIICSQEDEIDQLESVLRNESVLTTIVRRESVESAQQAVENWRLLGSDYSVLICSDETLGEIWRLNVAHLIHFSLPVKSSLQFSQRFILMFDSMHNFVIKPKQEPAPPPNKCTIILDDTNNVQLPMIADFLSRIGTNLPPQVINVAKNEREEKRKQRAINYEKRTYCYSMAQFGSCHIPFCLDRHEFFPHDYATRPKLPEASSLKVQLTHVHSPTHFSVRILEQRPPGGLKWRSYGDDKAHLKIHIELEHLKSSLTTIHNPCRIGDIYGFKLNEELLRARILDISQMNNANDETKVKLRLIDSGRILSMVSASKLYELPDHLRNDQDQCFDVFVMNVVPCDGETSWDLKSLELVDDLVKKCNSKAGYWLLNPDLCTADMIWTRDITFHARTAEKIRIAGILVKRRYGVEDEGMTRYRAVRENFLSSFPVEELKLAVKAPAKEEKKVNTTEEERKSENSMETSTSSANERELPKEVKTPKKHQPAREFWATLNDEGWNPVVLGHFKSPLCFYILKTPDAADYEELYKAVDAHVESLEVIPGQSNGLVVEWKEGQNCLVKVDGDFCRGKILRHAAKTVDVFLVDSAEFAFSVEVKDLLPITDRLVKMLEFGSCQVQLFGVISKDYEESIKDAVYAHLNGLKNLNALLFQERRDVEKPFPEMNAYDVRLYQVKEDGNPSPWYEDAEKVVKDIVEIDYDELFTEDLEAVAKEFAPLKEEVTLEQRPKPENPQLSPQQQAPQLNESNSSRLFQLQSTGYRPPRVTWMQNNNSVMLSVETTGDVKYFLHVDTTHLKLRFWSIADDEYRDLYTPLFGPVWPQHTRHGVVGFEIRIRLVKAFPGQHWLQLFKADENRNLVHFHFAERELRQLESSGFSDDENETPRKPQTKFYKLDDSSSDEGADVSSCTSSIDDQNDADPLCADF